MYIFFTIMASGSCCDPTALTSGVKAVLKKLKIMAVYCLLIVREVWLKILWLMFLSGSRVMALELAKLFLIALTVWVILERSLFFVSFGFMAKLAYPSKISLSLVWTVFSCLKMSLKSDHKG
jgi:hypothetical protein